MTRDHLRDEWYAEALDAADDEELWRQQTAIDHAIERQVDTWDDRRDAFAAGYSREELERVATKAVFAQWEQEGHADDMDGQEWRSGAA